MWKVSNANSDEKAGVKNFFVFSRMSVTDDLFTAVTIGIKKGGKTVIMSKQRTLCRQLRQGLLGSREDASHQSSLLVTRHYKQEAEGTR